MVAKSAQSKFIMSFCFPREPCLFFINLFDKTLQAPQSHIGHLLNNQISYYWFQVSIAIKKQIIMSFFIEKTDVFLSKQKSSY